MELHFSGDTPQDDQSSDNPRQDPVDAFDQIPELPSPHQRWTVVRKAVVIQAVRDGWVPIEEVCRLYSISVEEFFAWERDLDQYGVHGLRSTRYQIYRGRNR